MNQKEIMKNNLLKEIDGYFMQLVYLKDLIAVEEDILKHEKTMEDAPNFTLIVECALIDSYMLSLARLYDKSKNNTKTIPNLIDKCKKNVDLFSKPEEVKLMLNEYEKQLKGDDFIACTVNTITSRRDKILAHNDNKYFGEKLQNDNSYLKKYHIWILVKFIEEILNYLVVHLSAEIPRSIRYDNDLEKILKLKE